jgi:hypothetical protein
MTKQITTSASRRQTQGNMHSYRFTRTFADLVQGPCLYAATARQAPVRVFMRQATALASDCGLLCVGMALSILGVIKASAFEVAPRRRYGLASDIWRALGPDFYFNGVAVTELAERLQTLDVPVRWTACVGKPQAVDDFTVDALLHGDLVILAYENISNHWKHYVLAVGVSGITNSGTRRTSEASVHCAVDSIYVVDPSGNEPVMATHNGLLRRTLSSRHIDQKPLKRNQWRYETAYEAGFENVVLIGAIRLQRVSPKRASIKKSISRTTRTTS